MPYDLLITDGLVVSPTETRRADVAVVGDRIAEIGPNLRREGARQVVDADDKYVIPGGIDVHTHLDMPLGGIHSADDFETGTRAAAFGGTTTIIDYAAQSKGESLHNAIETWKQRAAGRAVVDYGFHCTITDLNDSTWAEMDELVAEGVPSFKLFMAYPGRMMLDDGAIFRALQRTAHNGGLVCMHAENGPVIDVLVRQAISQGHTAPKYHALTRPPAVEGEAVNRTIALAEIADAPVYIVHVSCEDALRPIAVARARRSPVFAETCPQYLFSSLDSFDLPGFEGAKYVFTPPPRERRHQQALWDSLREGVLQTVATDHCPFNFHGQKDRGRDDFTSIPNGAPGVEHRLSLLFTGGVAAGRFTVNQFVDMVAATPAKLFGLYPRKGVIAVGSDADVVVFDPAGEQTISAQTHHMRVDYSLYQGMRVIGTPKTVIARGRVIVDDGNFFGRPGAGEFLPRKAFTESTAAAQ